MNTIVKNAKKFAKKVVEDVKAEPEVYVMYGLGLAVGIGIGRVTYRVPPVDVKAVVNGWAKGLSDEGLRVYLLDETQVRIWNGMNDVIEKMVADHAKKVGTMLIEQAA